jgi:shikimate dehydrogenase
MKDLRSISTRTQFCAVIGNPVAHSLSPAIHNAAFAFLGLDFVYLACPVEDVRGALAGMRAIGTFRGMSVTIPHKMEAMRWVDEVAEVDRSIGSINTVVREEGRLIGMGTDGPAAIQAIAERGVNLDGKHVLMLGAGGAARAISFTLARMTRLAELTILDINEALLNQLGADLRNGTQTRIGTRLLTPQSLAESMSAAELVVHCTSIGMHPREDASLVPPELFRPGQVVFDIVYTPLETKLIADARARGLQVIPGVDMFVNQAALQFRAFTGVDAPVDVMRQVVLDRLRK